MPVDARRRRSRVLRVRIVLYSGSVEGFGERDLRESKQGKTIRQRRRHLPSNFQTATFKERLQVPAVAVAVSSVSVSSSTEGQLKVLVSAIFENQSKENYTPKSKTFTFQFPNGEAGRTPGDVRRCRSRVLRVRAVLYSKSIEGLYERDVRKSKLEKLYAKP